MTAEPLSVEADLTVTVDGADVRVRGYGDLVVVDAPTLRAARALLRGTDSLPGVGVGDLAGGLDRADLDVDVRVRGHSVARMGPDVEPGFVSRVAGLAPARVSLGGGLLALLGR